MPLLILSVRITEPPPTRRAMYGRRVRAGGIVGCDALTQPLQVRALALVFFYRHNTLVPSFYALVCTAGK